VHEIVELAGGVEVLASAGHPSRRLSWEELKTADPDVLLIMPCGFDLERATREFQRVLSLHPWQELKAFRNGQIHMMDANSYFSRSGPRLVDGLERIAEILHPEYFRQSPSRKEVEAL